MEVCLFNDSVNTFLEYVTWVADSHMFIKGKERLYDIGHMVKYLSDSERGNPLPPHWLLFPISSKGSFVCIPQTG